MAETPPPVVYRFAQFELQPEERLLLANGAPARIGPHAFDVLLLLLERRGHLVTKAELLERVWPGLVVGQNTLQVHISALRRVLGADAIATVTGEGYRFVPGVTEVHSTPPTPIQQARHNLPLQLTSFIGRDNEIAELTGLLGTTRMLTLTGAGGCGKSRLAMQLACGLVDRYADGLWLVELASLEDPALVAQTVANVLGIKEVPRKDLTQVMAEQLATKQMLLLFDNAEHLLQACAELVEALLRRCAGLVIVATSRERLGIGGESTFRVPSLTVPDLPADAEPERILGFESARLFVDRARLQRPHFTATAGNAQALASICRRLDGIPLAIELAAPRVRAMSVEELSRHLDQRFELLVDGSRTSLPRHRTLRSLIDWSYNLLSPDEAALLRRLSVFAGGWTLEAAEQVCAGDGIGAAQVLDLLTSLVDKSLAVANDRDGATRYWLLETVRHYASDCLHGRAEEAQTHARHLAHFLAMAETAEAQLKGPEQHAWLERLAVEHDNMRAALTRSACPGGDAVGGLQLAGTLYPFWMFRGFVGEGRSTLTRQLAVATARPASAGAPRAKALYAAGAMAYLHGDDVTSQVCTEECLAIRQELGDRRGMALAQHVLASTRMRQGHYAAARALYEANVRIFRELGDEWTMAVSLVALSSPARAQKDFAFARASLEEGLTLMRKMDDPRSQGLALSAMGSVLHDQGDLAAAEAAYEESLAILRKLEDHFDVATTLNEVARLARAQHRATLAVDLQKQALRIWREVGNPNVEISESLEGIAQAMATGSPERAARMWGKAQAIRDDTGTLMYPAHQAEHDRLVAAARAAMGGDVMFDTAWQVGRRMTLEESVQWALDTPPPANPPDAR